MLFYAPVCPLTVILILDIQIKFQMWKHSRKGGMYLLHVPETGKSQLLLPSVDPAGKSGLLLPPIDPSIYGGTCRG